MGFFEKDRVVVKTYKNEKEYRKDAPKMAKQGYRVVSTLPTPDRHLLWRPTLGAKITVTYELGR